MNSHDDYNWLFDEPSEKEEFSSFSIGIKNYHEPIWTTKSGDKIALSKMETRHIHNCIRLLESKNMFKNKWHKILNDELERRRMSEFKVNFSL